MRYILKFTALSVLTCALITSNAWSDTATPTPSKHKRHATHAKHHKHAKKHSKNAKHAKQATHATPSKPGVSKKTTKTSSLNKLKSQLHANHLKPVSVALKTSPVKSVKAVKLADNSTHSAASKIPGMALASTDAQQTLGAPAIANTTAVTPAPVKHKPVVKYKETVRYKDVSVKKLVAGRYFVGTGVGMVYPNTSGNNSVVTGSGWPNDYYGNTETTNAPVFFLTGGYMWERQADWIPYYGLAARYSYAAPFETKGYINQYSLPAFKNYNYQYHIQQQNILGLLKADIYRWNNLMPYLMLGAGLSINSVSDFNEQPTSGVTPRVSPGFGSRVNTNFAYTFGVGLDYVVKDNVWVNLEYNYGYFGTVKTGRGADTASLTGDNFSGSSLKNTLDTNTVLLGVTYYLG